MMNNLERVRDYLDHSSAYHMTADLDAHLKEDAERDADLDLVSQRHDAYKAELAELRETENFLSQRHELDEVALAELRVSNQAQYEAANKYQAQLTELREAVREHIDGNGAPNRTHDRLRQLIEEKDERGPAATDSAISKARRGEKP